MLHSLISAFLMYTRIPMPHIKWTEKNRRYALGFFPAVGAVIGFLLIVLRLICTVVNADRLLFSAGAVLLPILVTGGIHLDGYCDVTDANASYQNREKRLEIMHDPHIGSFAVIRVCLYLIVQFALFAQIDNVKKSCAVACGYILSRVFSGLAAVCLPSARKNGSLQSFVKPMHKRNTLILLAVWALLACCALLICPIQAGCGFFAAGCTFLHFSIFARKQYGGVTGDLCGWFLQRCELAILAGVVLISSILEEIA